MKPSMQKTSKPDGKLDAAEMRSLASTLKSVHDEEIDDLDDEDGAFPDLEPIVRKGPPPPDAKPNPFELPAPINPEGGRKQSVEMHRNLFCQNYDGCLDEAVKRGWNSFTCVRCDFYHTNNEEAGGVERFATQRKAN